MWDKHRLRTLFDQNAQGYHQSRPGYPEALFDDIIAFSGITLDGRVLEIGAGPGQATVPFARHGYRMLCIEPGVHLADILRENVRDYPQVEIYNGTFEQWSVEQAAFDLVVSATAFHWVDTDIAYPKVRQALKSSGILALFWQKHVRIAADENFFRDVHEVYKREAPILAKDGYSQLPWSHEIGTPEKDAIDATGLFGEVTTRRYFWEVRYDANSYIHLLETYSDHIALEDEVRTRLFRSIADLIDSKFHGHITKGYMTVLYLAHCK